MSEDNCVKIIFLGTTNVGKSSIFARLCPETTEEKIANIQNSTASHQMSLQIKHKDKDIAFEYWDTAGQEKYAIMTKMFVRNSNIAILTYAIDSEESFENLSRFVSMLRDESPDAKIIVTANKLDLDLQRVVRSEKGAEYARSLDAKFIEISALKNEKCDEFKQMIVEEAYSIVSEGCNENVKGIDIKESKKKGFFQRICKF